MASSQESRLAGRLGGWEVRRWERVGHPSPLCCAVIRRPSGSGGLFELYVPLIIHLGRRTLDRAHKDLIYALIGNERSWRCWAEIWDCCPHCQEIEVMDGTQRNSTCPKAPPSSPTISHISLSTSLVPSRLVFYAEYMFLKLNSKEETFTNSY